MIKDNEINSYNIADFFLTKSELTPKKIQKLVYYAYSWFIAFNNQSADQIINVLFDEVPEAWIHGPVFRSLYDSMRYKEFYNIEDYKINCDQDTKDFLDIIYKLYGKYSGNQLENMTHIEDPWKNARLGKKPNERSTQEISDEDIEKYYSALLSD